MQPSSTGSDNDGSAVSRRSLLKASGAGLTVTGLAGCLGRITGGGGGTVNIGGTVPLSGPYGFVGKDMRRAIRLGIKHAEKEGDAGDRKIKVEFKDTKTDPSTGRKKAQEHIKNGVDFLIGSLSSAVALSISGFAERENVIYQGFAGSNAITGKECKRTTFVVSNSATQQTSGGLGSALATGAGKSVFELSADYAWGQSIHKYNKNKLVPRYDAEYVGNIFLPLGTGDFSAALTKAMDSGADILNVNFAFSDLVSASKQAHEFGVLDEMVFTTPAYGLSIAQQIPWGFQSNSNFFGSVPHYWNMNETSRKQFGDPFEKEYGKRPFAFSGHAYSAVRTTLKAIGETGSTKSDDLVDALEGRAIEPDLWQSNSHIRACDHRGTCATTGGRGRDVSERPDNADLIKIVYKPDNVVKEQMRTCEATGCDGPFAK